MRTLAAGGKVGILAGDSDAVITKVWTTGKVVGSGDNVGGVVGAVDSGNIDTALATIMMSWSTADVEGNQQIGGLIGLSSSGNADVIVDNNWAAGDVIGSQFVGGFSGVGNISEFTRNWSAGGGFGCCGCGRFYGNGF